MPWKECHVVDERLRFVARLLDGEKMTALCEEFGISRKTGYKIFRALSADRRARAERSQPPALSARESAAAGRRNADRAAEEGPPDVGRAEDSRAPAPAVARHRVSGDQHRARRARSPWPGDAPPAPPPAAAHRDAARRGRSRPTGSGAPTTKASFCSRNQRYCYPLTITDYASRYLLACEALSTTQERYAFSVFERAFQEFGLPDAIRTDNGVPFASAHALYGLSKLAVWWLRLGIRLERIAPGHPEQNGRHERMHLTLKTEATRPAAQQRPAAAGALRHLRASLQPRTAAPGARHGHAGEPLHAVDAPLSRARGARLSVSRLDRRRHPLRPHLLSAAQDQSQSGVCRPEGGREAGRRPHLAGQLYGLRLGVSSTMRRVDSNRSMIPSVRNCYLCLRNNCYLCPRNELLPMSQERT